MAECAEDERPLVASICGTFLKPEMQSIYRQVTGLRDMRTIVYTQSHENAEAILNITHGGRRNRSPSGGEALG